MKKIIISVLFLSAVSAQADCFPPEWKLPNKGKDCVQKADFGKPVTAKLFSCKTEDSSEALFLMTGQTVVQSIDKDVCFKIDKIEEQIHYAEPSQ